MDRWREGIEALRSDEHLRRRARRVAQMSVEERLLEAIALCRAAAALLGQMPAATAERARGHREALPPGAEDALRRLLVGS
jgi:hypothetical protein